jgi:predicted alpha/beta hydrolase family esterase
MIEEKKFTRRQFIKGISAAAAVIVIGFPEEASGTLVYGHGHMGNPKDDFFTELGERMWQRHKILTVLPRLPLGKPPSREFPDGQLPNLSQAIDELGYHLKLAKMAKKPAILGGVSLGAFVAAAVASEPSSSMNGLVTAAMRYRDETLRPDHALANIYNWDLINPDNIRENNSGEWIHMHCKKDGVVPFENAERIATLGAIVIPDEDRGHYSKASDGLYVADRISQYMLPTKS